MALEVADCDRVLKHLDEVHDRAVTTITDRFAFWQTADRAQQLGALKTVYLQPRQVLERNLPAVVLGDFDEKRWIDLAQLCESQMVAVTGIAQEATFDWVVRSTATETGKDAGELVKTGLNAAGAAVGAFALTAIPWWLWLAAAGGVAWKLGLVGGKKAA